MPTSMINYTGKIHKGYYTGTHGKSPSRAACNDNIVMAREFGADRMAKADDHQFCGRCFPKGKSESRKDAALEWAARVAKINAS